MKIKEYFKNVGNAIFRKSSTLNLVHYGGSPFNFSFATGRNKAYRNKIVFSVVNLLVHKLSEVPIIVADVKNDRKARSFTKSSNVDPTRLLVNKVLGFSENPSHPLNYVLDNPNDYQTGVEFREAYWFNKLIFGRVFILVEYHTLSGREGMPKRLHVVPAYMVEIIENKGNFQDPIRGYRITYDGKQWDVPKKDIMFDGSWSPDSHFDSWDLDKTIGQTVLKNEINEHAQMAAFKNGGTGILFSSDVVVDGVGGVSDKLPAEAMKELKEVISSEYSGASNNKRMHFTNGFVNVTSFGDTIADLELLKAHDKDVEAICAFYNINPTLLYFTAGSATEANVQSAYKSLVTNNVVPKLRKFDALLTKFSRDWYKKPVSVYHDVTEFSELLPDYKLIKEVYGNSVAVTPNEYRELLGYTRTDAEGMDRHYITTGYIPLEDAGIGGGYDPSGLLNREL